MLKVLNKRTLQLICIFTESYSLKFTKGSGFCNMLFTTKILLLSGYNYKLSNIYHFYNYKWSTNFTNTTSFNRLQLQVIKSLPFLQLQVYTWFYNKNTTFNRLQLQVIKSLPFLQLQVYTWFYKYNYF